MTTDTINQVREALEDLDALEALAREAFGGAEARAASMLAKSIADALRLLDAERAVRVSLAQAAYDAGFMAAGEGWNGEYPGDAPQTDYYKQKRAEDLAALSERAKT